METKKNPKHNYITIKHLQHKKQNKPQNEHKKKQSQPNHQTPTFLEQSNHLKPVRQKLNHHKNNHR